MKNKISFLTELILKLPWPEILADAWKYARRLMRGLTNEGMYEVLDYEAKLEILNRKGTRSHFKKWKHIRYLQDNIIAYQDYAWGDGNILLDYRCTPGKQVDRYRLGYKTYILLSLGTVRNRGDEDEYRIQWRIKDGFLTTDGFWETDISQRTKKINLCQTIFPLCALSMTC